MALSHTDASSRMVAVDLEPALLADLLRRQLADRGVAVADPRAPRRHVAAALVGPSSRAGVDADILVRLPHSGEKLPAAVEVEIATPGVEADTPRLVVVATAEALVDLLVALTEE